MNVFLSFEDLFSYRTVMNINSILHGTYPLLFRVFRTAFSADVQNLFPSANLPERDRAELFTESGRKPHGVARLLRQQCY